MDEFRRRLRIEYENEYKNEYCKMKSLLFSKPKIYDAGGDTSKRWYVYFYYRNPQTGKMERQSPIYQNANRIKDARERKKYLTDIRNVLEKMLNEGCVPTATNFICRLPPKTSAKSTGSIRFFFTFLSTLLLRLF